MRSAGNGDMNDRRLVLFVDILGFKALVRSVPLPELVERFNGVFASEWSASARLSIRRGIKRRESATAAAENARSRETLTAIAKDTGFSTHVMSDSLVIYSAPTTLPSAEGRRQLANLVVFARVLALRLFEKALFARGAIVYGDFHADESESLYLGAALVDAYELSNAQEWIGIVLSDSVSKAMDELVTVAGQQTPSERVVRPGWDLCRYEVPLKSGPREAWVVNWVSAFNFGGPMCDDFFAKFITGDPNVDVKYQNTLKFMKHIHQSLAGLMSI
jgi:hypothetical protein